MAEIKKAWMWGISNGGINGLNIDDIDMKIIWFDDAIACACGDSAAEQTFEEFKNKGPVLHSIPDDVLGEVHESVHLLTQ